MQRISALWHDSPLKIVSALFVLSLAAMMAVASGASFTSTSANPGNIVTAGTMSHGNSKAAGAILNVSDLKPGESQSGTVDISNTGDTAGVFTLSSDNVANSDTANPLSSKLDLLVEDLGPPSAPTAPSVEYAGKLGAMPATGLATFAPSAAHRYKFTVTFPDGGTPAGPTSGDNAYKGDNVTVDYNWESVSN
jgi:spore coat-associated protein N